MKRPFLYLLLLSGGLALGGCVDRYTPDVPAAAQANLVVDGFLNPLGSTVVKLSRTFSINTKNTAPAETRAQVAIQDDAGRRYGLSESASGVYTSAALALDPNRQYQLRITTSQGREYASDLVPAVLTPPIDSLTWRPTTLGGVQIYVSAHGASTATRYYRWEYEETWQFTSPFYSRLVYVPSTGTIENRTSADQIYTCWRTESSTSIVQGNTTQLSQNSLVAYPLLLVPPNIKTRLGYSILVHQYAESPAEYAYWELLRKNTENLGTVNDPLPARITGNVHALSDPAEVVLGYVGAHSIVEKRLFVDGAKLPVPRPSSVYYDPFYATCTRLDSLRLPFMLARCQLDGSVPVQPFPLDALYDKTIPVLLYYFNSAECVDCRLRGTNVKPSFWP